MSAARDALLVSLLTTLLGVGVWYAVRRWRWPQWRRWAWHLLTSCLPLTGVLLLINALPSPPERTADAWVSAAVLTALGCTAVWALVGVIEALFALSSSGAPSDYRLLRGPRTALLVLCVLIGIGVLLDALGLLRLWRWTWLVLATQIWWCAVAPPAFLREEARYRAWRDALGPRRLRWVLLALGAGFAAMAFVGPAVG